MRPPRRKRVGTEAVAVRRPRRRELSGPSWAFALFGKVRRGERPRPGRSRPDAHSSIRLGRTGPGRPGLLAGPRAETAAGRFRLRACVRLRTASAAGSS